MGYPKGFGFGKATPYTATDLFKPEMSSVSDADGPALVEGDTNSSKYRTGFPKQEGQGLSYWLQSVRCDPLLDHRSTSQVPSAVDTVVIGSGMTGTLITKAHLETWPEKTVVVLEAREFCSGATGRNAGHCKPDQWRGFAKYERTFGEKQAMMILKNEQDTWKALVKYVRDNDIDCDLWVGETLDVPMSPEIAAVAKDSFERYKRAGGNIEHIKVTQDPEEAVKISRLKGAQACYSWPASTLHPFKLTAHIMRSVLSQFGTKVNLQTYTVVEGVSASPDNSGKWLVKSSRGTISCSQVVYATNAYSGAILPSMRGLILPRPHMCNKVVPPRTFCGSKTLKNSYGVLLPDGAFFSINPRSIADGIILFGGENPGQKKLDEWLNKNPEQCIDDGLGVGHPAADAITSAIVDFANSELEGWNDDAAKVGSGQVYNYNWSGIIGESADGIPFVGAVPGLPGQWICAGHHGHGMARIFTAAPGLVRLMNGETWGETKLPDVFQLTPQRVERLRTTVEKSMGKKVATA